MSRIPVLRLVRAAPTDATLHARFPADEPLDEAGRRMSARLVGLRDDRVVVSPARRARQTVVAAGLDVADTDPELGPLDLGDWAGATVAEVAERDPAGLTRWRDDPTAAPHGGESLVDHVARVAVALERWAGEATTTLLCTHGGPVRAAVLLALDAPPTAFWRIDALPCHLTELHRDRHGWRLRHTNRVVDG